MSNMSSTHRKKCSAIIHTASISAGAIGAGLAQIPCSDNALITPIQLTMTIGIGRVFGAELSESSARASLASVTAATIGRSISQVLVGWVPGIGNAINAGTAASVTEAVGWLLANDFAARYATAS